MPTTSETKRRKPRMARKEVQRRYRQNRRAADHALETSVAALHAEVAACQRHLAALRMTAVRQHETELKVAFEYFRLFRHGCPAVTHEIGVFLHTHMHSDVRVRGQTGPDALLQLWRFPNAISHGICIDTPTIQAIELGSTAMVRAVTTARLRISRTTVAVLYPQILSNEALVQRLIGREVHVTIVCHLYFDESACVVEIDSHNDRRMTLGLSQLLGSLDDTHHIILT